jgi:hypothetical protein
MKSVESGGTRILKKAFETGINHEQCVSMMVLNVVS